MTFEDARDVMAFEEDDWNEPEPALPLSLWRELLS